MPNVGQELLNVPFAEMVEKLALAVAKGQTALDQNSTATAKALATTTIELPKIGDPGTAYPVSLIALGIYPQFYQFSTAEIEVDGDHDGHFNRNRCQSRGEGGLGTIFGVGERVLFVEILLQC